MYKFNFLNKINQDKVLARKARRMVLLVFFSVIFALLLLLGFGYWRILAFQDGYADITNDLKRAQQTVTRIKSRELISNNKFRKIYDFQSKRINWLDLLGGIEGFLDTNTIVSEMNYDDNNFSVTYKLKTTLEKSDVLIKITSYKDSLADSPQVKKYLTKEAVQLIRGPELESDYENNGINIWSYTLDFNLEGIVKAKSLIKSKRNKRGRFN